VLTPKETREHRVKSLRLPFSLGVVLVLGGGGAYGGRRFADRDVLIRETKRKGEGLVPQPAWLGGAKMAEHQGELGTLRIVYQGGEVGLGILLDNVNFHVKALKGGK